MEPDFTGWATKANLKCTDGRTIAPGAFSHQDQMQVPLVWQHGHDDPENVLGHVLLENHDEGVRVAAFFNDTKKGQHAKAMVAHKDIKHLSIWANQLTERAKTVLHGAIREVSLVMAGANPGALIDPITLAHGDGFSDENLEDEAIIYTGETIEITHADAATAEAPPADNADGPSIEEVYNTMNEDQKEVLHLMLADALTSKTNSAEPAAQHDDNSDQEGTPTMGSNVFDKTKTPDAADQVVLAHDDMVGIFDAAKRNKSSLKDEVESYALAHGIDDIDVLFPDAKAVDNIPEWIKRRTEWVSAFLGGTRKSPFSKIKTLSADLTFDDARAKGYIKGTLKKEEFFGILARTTTPTTVYKKQKLDRDDIIDITDFDVVAWLRGEMRIMLDEEIARAALIGDGRDVADDDKINEQNIRPIASDHQLYTTQVYVNINDASSSIQEFIDAVVTNRRFYKGSGLPVMYTTEVWIAQFLLLKDSTGRRIYKSLDELASELRVSSIVPVEVLEDEEDIIAIFVNPQDYVMGATRGGEVSMFDDFDIDYNQYKYLIETRLCGALVKVKSAICFRKVAGTDVLVASINAPTFVPSTGALTIVATAHVVYTRTDTDAVVTAGGSPYTIAAGTSVTIVASPASGYYFATSNDTEWTFTADA